jgi:hypothetical protein
MTRYPLPAEVGHRNNSSAKTAGIKRAVADAVPQGQRKAVALEFQEHQGRGQFQPKSQFAQTKSTSSQSALSQMPTTKIQRITMICQARSDRNKATLRSASNRKSLKAIKTASRNSVHPNVKKSTLNTKRAVHRTTTCHLFMSLNHSSISM